MEYYNIKHSRAIPHICTIIKKIKGYQRVKICSYLLNTKHILDFLKMRYIMGFIQESDYLKITGLLLAEYFPLKNGWCVTPEFVLEEKYAPDY